MKKRIILLAAAVICISGCTLIVQETPEPTPQITAEPTAQPTAQPDIEVNNITIYNYGASPEKPEDAPSFSYTVNPSIISNRSVEEIDSYINDYVRPLYKEVENNLMNYGHKSENGISAWYNGKGTVKKKFDKGVNGHDMIREYYYDTDSGRIAFAFIHWYSTEYRLYFRENQLVRYAYSDPDAPENIITVNNPTSDEALTLGSYVIWEAYQN